MRLINKIIVIILIVAFILPTYAYSLTDTGYRPEINEIKQQIKKEYGVNIVLNDVEYDNIENSVAIIEKGLSRFPKGLFKEITNEYLKKGIVTNIIISKSKGNSFEIPAKYEMTNTSANIVIYLLENNYYDLSDIISLDALIHELGYFICEYLFEHYDYDLLYKEFSKLNKGYEYGKQNKSYNKVFVNKNSANSLVEDITDLIWMAEAYPEKLRELDVKEIIHNKIEYLAGVFDEVFESIDEQTRLWADTIPDTPDSWALNTIKSMKKQGLIPEEFEGKYSSYITKEDFYILSLKLIKTKLGEEEFYKYFNISNDKSGLNIDPVNGSIADDNKIFNEYYNINLCNNRKDIYEGYKIGLVNDLNDNKFNPGDNVTWIEAIKMSAYICEEFGINIANYQEVDFSDLSLLKDYEKPYVYFAVNEGLIERSGVKLTEFCTYQDIYILMDRVYKLIK